jgi:hypothetical protein
VQSQLRPEPKERILTNGVTDAVGSQGKGSQNMYLNAVRKPGSVDKKARIHLSCKRIRVAKEKLAPCGSTSRRDGSESRTGGSAFPILGKFGKKS